MEQLDLMKMLDLSKYFEQKMKTKFGPQTIVKSQGSQESVFMEAFCFPGIDQMPYAMNSYDDAYIGRYTFSISLKNQTIDFMYELATSVINEFSGDFLKHKKFERDQIAVLPYPSCSNQYSMDANGKPIFVNFETLIKNEEMKKSWNESADKKCLWFNEDIVKKNSKYGEYCAVVPYFGNRWHFNESDENIENFKKEFDVALSNFGSTEMREFCKEILFIFLDAKLAKIK